MSDKLDEMWKQQKQFMDLLREKREFPSFPVDTSTKGGQKILKSITHECMHELFEANLLLKNSKDHRATDLRDFDRDSYVEELCDALHYFFEIAILSGVSIEELYQAYMKKGEINFNRVEKGY
jgi:predicted house-cleaning noncanonical NTP pyrophosphatase (MazG superfamily)